MEHQVPMIFQERQNSCWHAALRMLWEFHYKSDRLHPLPNVFDQNEGAFGANYDALGAYGLKKVLVDGALICTSWDHLLRTFGPMIIAGAYGTSDRSIGNSNGFAHVVVVRGVKGSDVLINDPWFGPVACSGEWLYANRNSGLLYLEKRSVLEQSILEKSAAKPLGLGRMCW